MKKTTSNMNSSATGFTLVELLTAIAIIGVLSGILFVGLGKARTSAEESVSQSNLRQLGAMMQMYVADDQGNLPYGAYTDEDTSGATSWDGLLVNAGLITRDEIHGILHAPMHESESENPRSYSMVRGNWNGVASTAYGSSRGNGPTTIYKIEDPARTLLLAERFHPSNSSGSYAFAVINAPQEQIDVAPDRTRFNYLFVDGHVERLEPIVTVGENGSLTKAEGYWSISSND